MRSLTVAAAVRNWLGWAMLWLGFAYLMAYGNLLESVTITGWNPFFPWAAWFAALLLVSVWHRVTGSRRVGRLELSLLFAGAGLRSIIYLVNDFRGPLGVWLVVLGYAFLAWDAVPSNSARECMNAPSCDLRRIPASRRE